MKNNVTGTTSGRAKMLKTSPKLVPVKPINVSTQKQTSAVTVVTKKLDVMQNVPNKKLLSIINTKGELDNSATKKIHCRLCDKDITGQDCQLLYDYNENVETRLGRKINIILNSKENYINLSNYCCSTCTSKIQICFSLLVEIQASDEVIRQTYEHLTEGTVVNTSTQTFLCEECKTTITGIKNFIRHYENHILKKTVVGSKQDLRITEIVKTRSTKTENDDDNVEELVEKLLDDDMTKRGDNETNNAENEAENQLIESQDQLMEVEDGVENQYISSNNDNESVMVDLDLEVDIDTLDQVEDPEDEEEYNNPLDVDQTQDDLDDKNGSDIEGSVASDDSFKKLVKVVKTELDKPDSESDIEDDDYGDEINDDNSVDSEAKGEFFCDKCNASFEYKYLLINHFMKDHKWLKGFPNIKPNNHLVNNNIRLGEPLKCCRYCNESFTSLAFRRHLTNCKNDFSQDRQILCQDCGKMYSMKQYKNHKRKHEPLPHPDGWPCELCGKKFKAKRFLKSHLGEHDENKKKICEICGKKLLPLSFFSHMLKHKEKKHICQYCGKGFTYQYSLKIHLRVHEGKPEGTDPKTAKKKEKVFCWYCRLEFTDSTSLNEHLKTSHDAEGVQQDTRFPCLECDKRFADMFTLKAHLKLIHEMKDEEIARFKSLPVYRYIECNVCHNVFNSENKVRIHMKQEHGLKPFEMEILKKECEKCGKRFASKQNLIHHINGAHLNIKPMTCDICHEKFSKHSSLIYHKLRHSGEKPFQCEFCQRSYRQRNDVIRHLARHVRDHELTLEDASAINNSPSPLVMKRRIFLKDSSINYQSIVRKSRRPRMLNVKLEEEVEDHMPDLEPQPFVEEEILMEGEIGEVIHIEEDAKPELKEEAVPDSMIYVEEVATEDLSPESPPGVQFMTVRPIYDEKKNTIILSNPNQLAHSTKNVTFRFVPSQLKPLPAVIVKKQEEL